MNFLFLPGIPISLLATALTILGFISSFFGLLWYWDEDRRAESFDTECREDIRKDPAFRGIKGSAEPEFVVTSDSRISKFKSKVKSAVKRRRDRPYKIVPVEHRSEEERQIELIFERCKEIHGKTIISQELLAAIRNYYAYKLALSRADVDSSVTEHFRSKLDDYQYSTRVLDLAKKETYSEVVLASRDESEKKPLDDIFLPILEGVENHCVKPITDTDQKENKIEQCRRFMMFTFWGLYTRDVKGLNLECGLSRDECVAKYRDDVKEDDNIGYWILSKEGCTESDFKKLKYIGFKVSDVLDYYWNEDNFSTLHPAAENIPDMEFVERPFVLFNKKLEEFDGGPTRRRIKGEEKFRRKKQHTDS